MSIYKDSLDWLVEQANKVERNNSATIISATRLQELVERATPKKVIYENNDSGIGDCPNCSERIFTPDFCPKCGQALDWSKKDV